MGKNRIYIFDVDGTLTPHRARVEPEFETFFRQFVADQNVYLISGSDIAKIKEQLPEDILNTCRGVFGCSGAEFWQQGKLQYQKDHVFPDEMLESFQAYIDSSPYHERYGNHIEMRIGMVNISVVGRDATTAQRKHYSEWDMIAQERKQFVEQFNNIDHPYEASAGGQISIDIVPKGYNKSMAMNEILKRETDGALMFFGDRMADGGNDKPLADALKNAGPPHGSFPVKTYLDTWEELKKVI